MKINHHIEQNKNSPHSIQSIQFSRFSGIRTFMQLPHSQSTEKVDFAIVGIPFDSCTSYRPGTRFGPSAVREVSTFAARPYNPRLNIDVLDCCTGIDYGDIGSQPGYIEECFSSVTEELLPLFQQGVIPVAIGGDHSVTLPELRACHAVHGAVALIHFDAHYDTGIGTPERPYSHGTPFYYAAKEGLVDTTKSIQIGIRQGLMRADSVDNSKLLGYQVITGDQCRKMSAEDIIEHIIQRVGNSKAFLTFDIDILDPAYAPGTGTPVPGGLTSGQVLDIVRGLYALNIVGYDLVEVSPSYDHSQITALTAATILAEFISHIAWRKQQQTDKS